MLFSIKRMLDSQKANVVPTITTKPHIGTFHNHSANKNWFPICFGTTCVPIATRTVQIIALRVIKPSVTNRCGLKLTKARSKLKTTIHHKKTRYRSCPLPTQLDEINGSGSRRLTAKTATIAMLSAI